MTEVSGEVHRIDRSAYPQIIQSARWSDEDNGTTQTWTNPPITLVTTAGKHVTLPGTDETTFIQNGAHVKAAS